MIEVKSLTKDFRTHKGAGFLLDNISFTIPERKLIAIIGTNGSGKSTLLKLLAGEIDRDSGEIFCQTRIDKMSEVRSLRPLYIDQDAGRDLVPSMSIGENLHIAQISGKMGTLRFPNRQEHRKAAVRALSKISMGLENRIGEQVRFLSGGEKQGLIIARAFLFQSKFLLLDEFVSALAHNLASRMVSIVRELVRESSCYCVLVTHELDLAFKYADELIFLHNGKLIANLKNSRDSQKEIIDMYSNFLNEFINNDR
jgi:ABC-type uncharacterized transport system ATPase component